jgi:hypothetical protein
LSADRPFVHHRADQRGAQLAHIAHQNANHLAELRVRPLITAGGGG